MSKPTNSLRVARHVKSFIDNNERYGRGDSYTVADTVIAKNDEGLITASINGKRFLLIETCTRHAHEGLMLFNAMAVKHLHAIASIMEWKFTISWIKGRPYVLNKMLKNYELKSDEYYNIDQLEAMKY